MLLQWPLLIFFFPNYYKKNKKNKKKRSLNYNGLWTILIGLCLLKPKHQKFRLRGNQGSYILNTPPKKTSSNGNFQFHDTKTRSPFLEKKRRSSESVLFNTEIQRQVFSGNSVEFMDLSLYIAFSSQNESSFCVYLRIFIISIPKIALYYSVWPRSSSDSE